MRADDDALLRCDQYFKSLDALRERWGQVAQLVHENRYGEARSLLATPPPAGLDNIWYDTDKRQRMEVMGLQAPHPSESPALIRARFYLLMGQPALADEAYATAEHRSVLEKLVHLEYHAHALVLLGRNRDAIARVEELARATQDDSARRQREQWIEALRDLDSGKLDVIDYLDAHPGPVGFGAIFRAHDAGRGLRDVRARRLMVKLFDRASDATASRLLRELAAESKSDPEDAASALLALGNLAHERGDAHEAVRQWQRAVDGFPDTRDWPKALFNIGVVLKEQEAFDRAIEVFQRLLGSNVNDLEPGAHLMEDYRNYRSRASWEIGLCRLGSGDAAGALEAFRTTREKYPFQSTCGNAHQEYRYQYAAFEGVCLEYLGRYSEAIGNYFEAITQSGHGDPFAARRLVDLYETGGAQNSLIALCDAVDAHHLAEQRRAHPDLEIRPAMLPTSIIRRVIEIRAFGREGRVDELADLLQSNSATGPYSPRDLRDNWIAHEAARTLERYPAQSLSTMLERAKSQDLPDVGWVYYALGLNGAPEAVALLEGRLAANPKQWTWLTLAFALAETGARGEAILDAHDQKVAQPGRHSWRESLDLYQKSYPDPWPPLPPLPGAIPLPTRLAEINEDVGLFEALPARAPIDRGPNHRDR